MTALEVRDLGKTYRAFKALRPWTLQEAVMSGFRNLRAVQPRWSLRHVSFRVSPGSALGVIGRNGAGKSTLLRLAGGVIHPDEGSVAVHGRLGGLLELTAGFHPDLTGRENAEIGGILRGLTRAQLRRRFEAIVAFAELEEAIDRPLRTYSSGMQMRLAFSVSVHCDPDLLLVDEVLAVGDAAFQNKCLDRICRMREKGCAIVLVSHDTALVQQICDEALWLADGRVAGYGSVGQVVHEYVGSLRSETEARTPANVGPAVTSQGVVLRMGQNRFGSQEIEITDVSLCTTSDPTGLELNDGDSLAVEIDYAVNATVEFPIFSVTIIHDDGRVCMSANTEESAASAPSASGGGHLTVRWPQVAVEPGTYFVEVGVYRDDWSFAYDYHARSYPLVVRNKAFIYAGGSRTMVGRPRAEWLFNREEKR